MRTDYKFIKDTMMFAVLNQIKDLTCYCDNDEVYEIFTNIYENVRDPEVIIAAMEKYKDEIKIGLATEKNSKPEKMPLDVAFNYYVDAVKFLASDEINIPCIQLEYVIGYSLEELYDSCSDIYDTYEVNGKEVKTWDDFKNYLLNDLPFINTTEEEIDIFVKNCKEDIYQLREEDESDEEFIKFWLDKLFNPDTIHDYNFDDHDWKFLIDTEEYSYEL